MSTSTEDWNDLTIKEFHRNGGKIGGYFEGTPVLLLNTIGARTGKPRTNPVMYLLDGDRWIVFASKAGASTNPDWFHNLRANPRVTVEVGDEAFEADALVVEGEEREILYARQAALYPGYAEYERMTTRKIPVVALTRATLPKT